LSAHPFIHQTRKRSVFIAYPLDDGFVLREAIFFHMAIARNTYLIMLLFRDAIARGEVNWTLVEATGTKGKCRMGDTAVASGEPALSPCGPSALTT
jgi:hypothetical protein